MCSNTTYEKNIVNKAHFNFNFTCSRQKTLGFQKDFQRWRNEKS